MPLIHRLVILAFVAPVGDVTAEDFPPLPDFQRRVNYIAWYRQAGGADDPENAYLAYARFMPGLVGSTASESDWPVFEGMFTSRKRIGPQGAAAPANRAIDLLRPRPWNPRRHPDWEASYQRGRAVLKQYADASKKTRLAAIPAVDGETDHASNLLLNVRLAYLPYLRACAKASMEAAWRMKDGKISSKRLVRTVEANLRVSNQSGHGPFLIDRLLAISIRALTYQQIRWALAHDVLSNKRINRLAKLLRRVDHEPIDMSGALAGECAFLLDELQYVYGPLGGGVRLNGNRYREVTGQNMGAFNRFALGARLESDPQAAAKAIFDAHVEMIPHMQPGYSPEHLQALGTLYERMKNSSKVAKALLLAGRGYGRSYQLAARCEADRRGTRLFVELFAFKARKGRWPKSLDVLGQRVPADIRQDVFREQPFVYVLREDGPLLYSVGPDGNDDGGRPDPHWGRGNAGGDMVFWPIPDSEELLAASRLNRIPEKDLTPLPAIGKKLEGRTIVVAAKVTATSSRPSRKHGQTYRVALTQDGTAVDLAYYQSVADRLTPRQVLKPGVRIRARVTVKKAGKAWRLKLRNPLDLAIED